MDIRNQKAIDGEEFFSLIAAGVANLNKNLKTVNELNVFPIPDGDTGDNMYHTISGGFERIRSIEQNDVGKRARALADGMLLNARGNSGVILSQLFAGLADGLDGKTTATVSDLAAAFNEGVKTAYLSVIKPVEGTILTVARESFGRGAETLKEDSDLGQYFTEVLKEMKVSLENTPNLLAVLKEAGVIDSGGAGLYYIADGMKRALSGEETITETAGRTEPDKNVDFSKFDEDTEMTFGYCTEFLLRLQNRKTDVKDFDEKVIIDYLSTIGDSIVCFKTGSIVKAHVHTFEPYKALEFCRSFGEFLTVKIENMTLQHNETIGGELAVTTAKNERKPFGVVAVATGAGVIEMFKDFGADVVIDGGQGNNPSAETFIKAFDEVNADDIFVLPNNSNIILTAKQAGKMYEKSAVHVIETKNIGDCYSALSMLDYSCGDAAVIADNMKNDAESVTTGMITRAIRDANLNGVDIRDGDYIGFTDKTMFASCKDPVDTFVSLCEKLDIGKRNFLIVIFGAEAKEEDKSAVASYAENLSNVEYYAIEGGQEVYDYIVIVE